jgi:hypothetical protein
LVGKLSTKSVGAKNLLPLSRRHLPQISKRARNGAATIHWERTKLLHSAAKLLTLRRSEAFHGFRAFEKPATLCRRHVIELRKPIQ